MSPWSPRPPPVHPPACMQAPCPSQSFMPSVHPPACKTPMVWSRWTPAWNHWNQQHNQQSSSSTDSTHSLTHSDTHTHTLSAGIRAPHRPPVYQQHAARPAQGVCTRHRFGCVDSLRLGRVCADVFCVPCAELSPAQHRFSAAAEQRERSTCLQPGGERHGERHPMRTIQGS